MDHLFNYCWQLFFRLRVIILVCFKDVLCSERTNGDWNKQFKLFWCIYYIFTFKKGKIARSIENHRVSLNLRKIRHYRDRNLWFNPMTCFDWWAVGVFHIAIKYSQIWEDPGDVVVKFCSLRCHRPSSVQ